MSSTSRPNTEPGRPEAGAEDPQSSERRGRGRLLTQIKGWVTVSEPSTQALKQHRKTSHQKAGVSPGDPRASTKLGAPVGIIPEHAIKPSGKGPDPEDVVRRKAEQARALRDACSSLTSASRASRSSQSSASFGSASSTTG